MGSLPWTQAPGIRPPLEKLWTPAPPLLFSLSTRYINPRARTASVPRRAEVPGVCCTVILTGIGADEQLAGYSLHRVCFQSLGLEGLNEEIAMELVRISSRNLGCDDRDIGDHGKEARFPFLDENVVSFLNSLPVWKKVDLTLPHGVGEKPILCLAAVELGLTASALLPKQAMQFGSRTEKLEKINKMASDKCGRLQILP
ncbi:asparagine synthetase domain-containing protein 1-like [Onychomys torridus]|uniref:asparagine synthetase domain-containing protein 1-like n=1 Tax=Onychomys torridus TaxID=38674 RepID=UPI00167F9D4C|nr:asparagine synthetase domain-containing protein 1-like [Onychomys torridus]